MKSVLISIQPKWVKKIASGEKTIEVRKTRPKLETPFKCYIYCTNGTQLVDVRKETIYLQINKPFLFTNGKSNNVICSTPPQVNRKVIGEFVCDKVFDLPFTPAFQDYDFTEIYRDNGYKDFSLKSTCLTQNEIYEYGKGKVLYGWHITDLIIYDKPKDLSDFKLFPSNDLCCLGFKHELTCQVSKVENCIYAYKPLTRPPQSWCYVKYLV